MKKLLTFFSGIVVLIACICPVATVHAASTPQPIAPVVITKPDDIGWEGYTVRPTLKFYVDEAVANSTGNITDPDDNNPIFKSFLLAIDYRTTHYPGQAVEINLRSDVTNVPNFGVRLVNVLVEGNGYSFKRGTGSVVRAFECSKQIINTEFRNVTFDGGSFIYGAGIVIEGSVKHNNIKFTNVNININVEAQIPPTGYNAPPRVLSFFDVSNVTFDNVDMSGSTCLNSPGYQWPIQISTNCHSIDLSGITGMPINPSGRPVAVAFWNNISLFGVDTEPYNIYAPDFPYVITYGSDTVHRTMAFADLADAKDFAENNSMMYPQYHGYYDEPTIECIIDLTTNTFYINSTATLERAVNFLNLSGHGPDHSATISGPDDVTMYLKEQKSRTFTITDAVGASYIFDFSEAVKDSDYILESSDESVIASADISIGDDNNIITFKASGRGETTISLKTMDGTTVTSFVVTVPRSPAVPPTGDNSNHTVFILFVLSAAILTMFCATRKQRHKQ